jgi:hypothetical protein
VGGSEGSVPSFLDGGDDGGDEEENTDVYGMDDAGPGGFEDLDGMELDRYPEPDIDLGNTFDDFGLGKLPSLGVLDDK